MTKLLLAATLLLHTIAFSQTKADYENTIRKIGMYYNLKKTDSLLNMYATGATKTDVSIWTGRDIDELRIRNGKMTSYEYAGEYNGMTLYRTEFARSEHMIGLQLDNSNKLLVFRFKVSSPYTDSLLQRK